MTAFHNFISKINNFFIVQGFFSSETVKKLNVFQKYVYIIFKIDDVKNARKYPSNLEYIPKNRVFTQNQNTG